MFEEDTRLYSWNSKVPNFLPPLDTRRSVRHVSWSHDPILDLTKTFYPSHFGPAKRVRRVFDSQKTRPYTRLYEYDSKTHPENLTYFSWVLTKVRRLSWWSDWSFQKLRTRGSIGSRRNFEVFRRRPQDIPITMSALYVLPDAVSFESQKSDVDKRYYQQHTNKYIGYDPWC